MDSQRQLRTEAFGPYRDIGMSHVGSVQNNEIPRLWTSFCARVNEIELVEQSSGFGVCRCFPGGPKGFGEYVAGAAAKDSAKLPEGMIAVDIPRCNYAVFDVPEIPQVANVWRTSLARLDAAAEWRGYCTSDGCGCATHPAFEYYPPGFQGAGPFFIYVPTKRA